MTPELENEIRQSVELGALTPEYVEMHYATNVGALLAEVDRLRQALAQYADLENWATSIADRSVWLPSDNGIRGAQVAIDALGLPQPELRLR